MLKQIPKIIARSLIGLSVGVVAGVSWGFLIGFGVGIADYIAHPPQGESFTFAFTMAAFTVLGGLTGFWTGLGTGLVHRRWVGMIGGAIIGFIVGFTWLAPTSWTLEGAWGLAIPTALIGLLTGITVFQIDAFLETLFGKTK